MKAALSKLGLKSYHMSEVFMNRKKGHFDYWLEALRAKYEGCGKPYGPEEFKRIFTDYDVSLFVPYRRFTERASKV